jgi:hypothetical protein
MNWLVKLFAASRVRPVARPSVMVGTNVLSFGLNVNRREERPSPRFHNESKRTCSFSTRPVEIFPSSLARAASKASGPASVIYGVCCLVWPGPSKASHVKNATSLLAGPKSSAACQISSSTSVGSVSAEIENSSRLSSSGSGPNSNVSRSGSWSSRSRGSFGAYGWSSLIDGTVCGQ